MIPTIPNLRLRPISPSKLDLPNFQSRLSRPSRPFNPQPVIRPCDCSTSHPAPCHPNDPSQPAPSLKQGSIPHRPSGTDPVHVCGDGGGSGDCNDGGCCPTLNGVVVGHVVQCTTAWICRWRGDGTRNAFSRHRRLYSSPVAATRSCSGFSQAAEVA